MHTEVTPERRVACYSWSCSLSDTPCLSHYLAPLVLIIILLENVLLSAEDSQQGRES